MLSSPRWMGISTLLTIGCWSLCCTTQTQGQDAGYVNQSPIIQTQSQQPQARLDVRIASMPKVQKKLEVIHNRSQLVQTRQRVTRIAIADPSIIDIAPFEETEFAIVGTNLGTTTLTLWFEGDSNPLIYEVTVIRDPNLEEQRRIDYGKLERKIAILFPNSKVYLIPLHEKIVVKGQARDAAEAARIMQIVRGAFLDEYGGLYGPGSGYGGRTGVNDFAGLGVGDRGRGDLYSNFIVNMLQVPGEFQVMLHVTIAELNRSQLRRLGVNINVMFNDGAHMITSAISGGLPTVTGLFNNGDVSVLINALASNGTAKILSRPSITVLSGHPAQFLAGGEFAVPTIVGVGGAEGTSTTFRGFGTSMVVVPTVVDSSLIRLQISPEFSQMNPNNSVQGIPGLDSRRVQTTVELREGQTIVLGGLLSRQMSTEVSRIPWLGELPYVGPLLFNTKRASEDEMELLVMVTPELVRAMDADEVPPLPGYYVTHPNDRELYRYAMTEGAPDLEVYQLAPYGNKVGAPNPVGFNVHNPSPATPQYAPIPHGNQPGYPTPAPRVEPNSRYGGYPGNMIQDQGAPGMQGQHFQGQAPQDYQAPGQMFDHQSGQPPQGYYTPQQIPQSGGMMHPQTQNMIPSPSQQLPMQGHMPPQAPPAYQPYQHAPGQQLPPGYQQAPAPLQGPPPQGVPRLAPVPSPEPHSYRGGAPTAQQYQQNPAVSQQSIQSPFPSQGQQFSNGQQFSQGQPGQMVRTPAGYPQQQAVPTQPNQFQPASFSGQRGR